MNHNLSLVEFDYRAIVGILLEWEDSLSDNFADYCQYATPDGAEKYEGDYVLATLVAIAKEILSINRVTSVQMLVAKAFWPLIDLAKVRIYQVPLDARWTSIPRTDHRGEASVELVQLQEIIIKFGIGYEPKSDTLVVQEVQLIEGPHD